MTISVINCGVGNTGSVIKMLSLFTDDVKEVDTTADLTKSSKIVLPGVGSFDSAMKFLTEKGFVDTLKELVLNKQTPLLGICLGMQIMCDTSEEGQREGIGFFPVKVKKFDAKPQAQMKVPHMGWNYVRPQKDSAILKDFKAPPKFYFAHSYHVDKNEAYTTGATQYGELFSSVLEQDNIFGVQFHPEKSHQFGIQLMKNFVEL